MVSLDEELEGLGDGAQADDDDRWVVVVVVDDDGRWVVVVVVEVEAKRRDTGK